MPANIDPFEAVGIANVRQKLWNCLCAVLKHWKSLDAAIIASHLEEFDLQNNRLWQLLLRIFRDEE